MCLTLNCSSVVSGFETLNFSSYIEELVENFLKTYRVGNSDISLNADLEENAFIDINTAIPLGIIINELVSTPSSTHLRERRGRNPNQTP